MGLRHWASQTFNTKTRIGRSLRAIRDGFYERRYAECGVMRTVNGVPCRVLPNHRFFFQPVYDAEVAAYLGERVKPGMTCFNVGANLGIYALQFAHWNRPDGRVFAFEPNPNTAKSLARHFELNGLAERARVVQMAVSAEVGTAPFFFAGTDGMSRMGDANVLLRDVAQSTQVEVTSLDAFCERENVCPDWMMIDIEGFEIGALRGAKTLIRSRHGRIGIVLEMHPDTWHVAGHTVADMEQILAELELMAIPLTGQADPIRDYGIVSLVPR